MKNYLIIDGSSILFRAFYAIPAMNTKDGKPTNAVLGFINILLKAIEMYKPSNIAVCFDMKGETFRTNIYEDYKANRSPAPEELSVQFKYIKEVLSAFNIKYFELEGYEADDLAGTLSNYASYNNYKVYLLSGDKDYLQLINKNTNLIYTKTGISELVEYTLEGLHNEKGISPLQMQDLKGLMGDKSDNIPGIAGIGEKTALKLLNQFGTIENLYENIDKLSKNKTNQKIIDNKEIAFISKKLAKININAPIDCEENTELLEFDEEKLLPVLNKFELNSIINRLNLSNEDGVDELEEFEINENFEINEIITEIKRDKKFAFKLFATNKPYLNGSLLKIGIKTKDNYYVNALSSENLLLFKDVFEDEKIEKLGYEIKEDILHLINNNIDIKNYTSDIVIAEYLLNPTENDYSIEKLNYSYGVSGLKLPDKNQLKKTFEKWENSLLNSYIYAILKTIWFVSEKQKSKLNSEELTNLYYDVELPLTKVLADMEFCGIYTDKNELQNIGKYLDVELSVLVNNIYNIANEEFNINSPKQLSEILFDKLGLIPTKKTKTGFSTSVEVLEELEDKHEIVPYILRYRTIAKLKSTYVDGLLPYIIGENSRVHSDFKQTIAATGRISSTEPNLQNIPVRTDEGRQLRKIFKARNSDYKLIDADYSQIELRVLADVSNDENMISAFANNLDIHTSTAAKVFDVESSEVTPLMRSRAKAVNFGIVYGISDFGLSRDLKISRKEAKEYIENYLARFSGIQKYMKEVVKTAYEDKFVRTKLGRKRYLPELESKNRNIRNFGERIALNMPIQGTAADIIKVAMINVYNQLKKRKLETKLVLQVHDELILEAPINEVEVVKAILKTEMENAIKLRVPLIVDMKVGDTWYETK